MEEQRQRFLTKYEFTLGELDDEARGDALWVAESITEYLVSYEGLAPWRWNSGTSFSFLMDVFTRRVSLDEPGRIQAVPGSVLRYVRFCGDQGKIGAQDLRGAEDCVARRRRSSSPSRSTPSGGGSPGRSSSRCSRPASIRATPTRRRPSARGPGPRPEDLPPDPEGLARASEVGGEAPSGARRAPAGSFGDSPLSAPRGRRADPAPASSLRAQPGPAFDRVLSSMAPPSSDILSTFRVKGGRVAPRPVEPGTPRPASPAPGLHPAHEGEPMMSSFLLALWTAALAQDSGFKLPVQETVLDNGLRVLVVERHEVPRVFCSLWWRVGSANETTGSTGLSHFFEHMMFMGTDVIGTRDAKKDALLNAQIESAMGKIREIKLGRLEAKRRGVEPSAEGEARFTSLWKEYLAAVEEQKKIIIPEHLSKIFQENGGTGLNATTSYDRTNYFVELPSNKVGALLLAGERPLPEAGLPELLPGARRGEGGAADEDRLDAHRPRPRGLLGVLLGGPPLPLAGARLDERHRRVHPGRRGALLQDPLHARELHGDLRGRRNSAAEIQELCRRYFGRLKPSTAARAAVVTQEPEQLAELRMEAEADAKDEIDIQWHGPSAVHKDAAACDLLMSAFSGRSGRLYRPLVEDQQLALETDSYFWSLRYGGILHVGVQPREGADLGKLEKAVALIVEEVRHKGITERELEKVRNQQMADLVRGLKTNNGISQQLGYFETVGSYADFFAYAKSLEAVTAADVQRCAEQYLKPMGRNVLVIRRKEKK